VICGVAWGLVNFGFLLWLPTNLRAMGMADSAATLLLAQSALLALPGIGIVIWLYHRWSSIKALVLFATLTTGSLLVFCALGVFAVHAPIAFIVATVMLLVSASGVIAMLIPYAAEIYPVQLRATGAGIVAASSKFGGILGAVGGVLGVFNDIAWSALLIAAPMALSALLLARSGVETRGRRLEDIERDVSMRSRAAIPID
jgi:putative MFS transporter